MDSVIITSVLVLVVIAVIEGVSLFCKPSEQAEEMFLAAVIAVYPDDTNMRERLEHLREVLAERGEIKGKIVIVDYGASRQQLEAIRMFCYENTEAVLTDPAAVEKILSKTFAIEHKT